MFLYLSSYRIGDHGAELARMVAGEQRVAVIRNALDQYDDEERIRIGREREHDALAALGLRPQALDLREYFGAPGRLSDVIDQVDGLWVVGGNTFVLRRAMRQSSLDQLLRARAADGGGREPFFYGGYSAGVCVVTPTLRGIHLADEPDVVPPGYLPDIIWDGLGFVRFCIAPHYRSDHPESESIEAVVAYYIEHELPFVALRDGEVSFGDTADWIPHGAGGTGAA
jgi:dipeptidase E